MDIDQLIAQLTALTTNQRRKLAKRAKVGYTTINNIVYKETESPGLKTLMKLEKALK